MISAKVGHGSASAPGQYRKAMMQGNVQRGWSMLTKVRSRNFSLSQVMPKRVKMPATVLGIVRRLVLNYFVGSLISTSIMYVHRYNKNE